MVRKCYVHAIWPDYFNAVCAGNDGIPLHIHVLGIFLIHNKKAPNNIGGFLLNLPVKNLINIANQILFGKAYGNWTSTLC